MVVEKRLICSLVLLPLLVACVNGETGFARIDGIGFDIDGRPFYPNGFNAYWMMTVAAQPSGRENVVSALRQASEHGMNVVRAWAFGDGGNMALQRSPGLYNEDVFKGLDFVVSEAKRYGLHLILSLVNNHDAYGGKKQYVQWARDQGHRLRSDDDFYTNRIIKRFYKNHVKTVLTRINTITGVAYKDDPAIFAWELMNEPRCESDISGATIQAWITEMAPYLKSIDSNHLLEVGMEGFYGDSSPERKRFNPACETGTDFIANHNIPSIDFATIHAYPDQWIPGSSELSQLAFLQSWIASHTHDAGAVLKKPLLITEFGRASELSGCAIGERGAFYGTVYDAIYASARTKGACVGGMFWQLLMPGMDNYRDGYEIVLSECPSAAYFIAGQARRISSLRQPPLLEGKSRGP